MAKSLKFWSIFLWLTYMDVIEMKDDREAAEFMAVLIGLGLLVVIASSLIVSIVLQVLMSS